MILRRVGGNACKNLKRISRGDKFYFQMRHSDSYQAVSPKLGGDCAYAIVPCACTYPKLPI